LQREVQVLADDYSEDLIQRINLVLQDVIFELAGSFKSGEIPRQPQNHSKATYYPKRTPADGLIDFSASTDSVYGLIRAAGRPYPGAFSFCDGQKLIIWRAEPGLASKAEPGRILSVQEHGRLLIATGDGAIWATEVEMDGVERPREFLCVGKQLGS